MFGWFPSWYPKTDTPNQTPNDQDNENGFIDTYQTVLIHNIVEYIYPCRLIKSLATKFYRTHILRLVPVCIFYNDHISPIYFKDEDDMVFCLNPSEQSLLICKKYRVSPKLKLSLIDPKELPENHESDIWSVPFEFKKQDEYLIQNSDLDMESLQKTVIVKCLSRISNDPRWVPVTISIERTNFVWQVVVQADLPISRHFIRNKTDLDLIIVQDGFPQVYQNIPSHSEMDYYSQIPYPKNDAIRIYHSENSKPNFKPSDNHLIIPLSGDKRIEVSKKNTPFLINVKNYKLGKDLTIFPMNRLNECFGRSVPDKESVDLNDEKLKFRFEFSLPSIGVSLISQSQSEESPFELLYLTLSRSSLICTFTSERFSVDRLTIRRIEIDNQLTNATYPVLLLVEPTRQQPFKSDYQIPIQDALEFKIDIEWKPQGVTKIRKCSLSLPFKFRFNIDSEVVFALFSYGEQLIALFSQALFLTTTSGDDIELKKPVPTLSKQERQRSFYFFESISLSASQISLLFCEQKLRRPYKNAILFAVIKIMGLMKSLVLNFDKFEIQKDYCPLSDLLSKLEHHYQNVWWSLIRSNFHYVESIESSRVRPPRHIGSSKLISSFD